MTLSSELSPQERVAELTIMVVPNLLSMLGDLSIIWTYVVMAKTRRHRYVEILSIVAICDFVGSLSVAIGPQQSGSFGCWFQGVGSNIFACMSFCWTTVLALHLYLAFYYQREITRAWMIALHPLIVLSTVLCSLLVLTTNSYGNFEDDEYLPWCFIVPSAAYGSTYVLFWRIMSFYIFIIVNTACSAFFAFSIYITLVQDMKARHLQSASQGNSAARELSIIRAQDGLHVAAPRGRKLNDDIRAAVWRLLTYPAITLLCWFCLMVDDLMLPNDVGSSYGRSTTHHHAMAAFQVMATSRGLLVAVAFFAQHAAVRREWAGAFSRIMARLSTLANGEAVPKVGAACQADASIRRQPKIAGVSDVIPPSEYAGRDGLEDGAEHGTESSSERGETTQALSQASLPCAGGSVDDGDASANEADRDDFAFICRNADREGRANEQGGEAGSRSDAHGTRRKNSLFAGVNVSSAELAQLRALASPAPTPVLVATTQNPLLPA